QPVLRRDRAAGLLPGRGAPVVARPAVRGPRRHPVLDLLRRPLGLERGRRDRAAVRLGRGADADRSRVAGADDAPAGRAGGLAMNALALYGRYAATSVRAQFSYAGMLTMMSVGQFLATVIEFLGIWALFHRFDHIVGWRLGEIALFYGLVSVTF